jgi:DnaJ-class molecular chaperone
VDLTDALLLFRRLGVDVQSLSPPEFAVAYRRLAKRYHPDRGNRGSDELIMANINAARTVIEKARREPR